jgi:hypothetical protein
VLNASFSKAIESADSEAALKAIREQIESVRSALGSRWPMVCSTRPKRKPMRSRMLWTPPRLALIACVRHSKQLGITSDETLKKTAADAKAAYDVLRDSGTASAREMGEAFKSLPMPRLRPTRALRPPGSRPRLPCADMRWRSTAPVEATLRLKGSVDDSAGSHSRAANAIDQHRTALERLNAERERIASQEKANELATRELQPWGQAQCGNHSWR